MLTTAESQAFVREGAKNNVHPRIDEYFRACGWKTPEKIHGDDKPWCAAFVTWVLKQCGLLKGFPRNFSAASVRAWDRLTKRIIPQGETLPGDVVTYRTWSHMEFAKFWPKDPRIRVFRAIGGNTSAGSGQQGVFVDVPRPKSSVRNVLRFIPAS